MDLLYYTGKRYSLKSEILEKEKRERQQALIMHDEYGSETLMACLGRNETDTGRREENCQISLFVFDCVSLCVWLPYYLLSFSARLCLILSLYDSGIFPSHFYFTCRHDTNMFLPLCIVP